MIKLRGEVEIIGKENGKTIYYDKGPNTVTYWARHAVMHLLTGDSFTTSGEKRSILEHSFDNNPDGTLLSGSQYFHDNRDPDYDEDFYWSKASTGTNDKKYPIMPVKMLFGTGHEFKNYSDFIDEGVELKDEWENETIFNTNINQNLNSTFSNIFEDITSTVSLPRKTRTVNSRTSEPITNKEIKQDDLAISGAIKSGSFTSKNEENNYTEISEYGRILKKDYRGVGNPCFIYPLRGASTFNEEKSQVMLTEEEVDENILETKLTFTVVMPEQTGSNSDEFYPYNGYTIKEVGLFSDSHLFLKNVQDSYDRRMPYGLMFAKRYITPFVKTANSSFTIRWTIYI